MVDVEKLARTLHNRLVDSQEEAIDGTRQFHEQSWKSMPFFGGLSYRGRSQDCL